MQKLIKRRSIGDAQRRFGQGERHGRRHFEKTPFVFNRFQHGRIVRIEPGLVPHFVEATTTVATVASAYELPDTGSETGPLLGGGLAFLAVGVLCLWARRPVRA